MMTAVDGLPTCQIRARLAGHHRGTTGNLGKSIYILAGERIAAQRSWASTVLAVWGSGVRVPSAPRYGIQEECPFRDARDVSLELRKRWVGWCCTLPHNWMPLESP